MQTICMRKANTPAAKEFTRHDRHRLGKALKSTEEATLYQRIQAVWLMAQGYAVSDISRSTGSPRRSIHRWQQRYLKADQVQDLPDKPRIGRPKAAPVLTAECILEVLRSDPLEQGYSSSLWTVALLTQHFNERHGHSLSAATLRRRMKQT